MPELSDRFSSAKPGDERELFTELWETLNPKPDELDEIRRSPKWKEWDRARANIARMVHADAYLSVAEACMPEGWAHGAGTESEANLTGWAWLIKRNETIEDLIHPDPVTSVHGEAATPALALGAAIAKARGV